MREREDTRWGSWVYCGLISPLIEFGNPGSWHNMEEYDKSDFCGGRSAEYVGVICQKLVIWI